MTLAGARAQIERGGVDVLLLDYDLGAARGTDLLAPARESGLRGPVIIVSAWLSDAEIRAQGGLGITGVVLKGSPIDQKSLKSGCGCSDGSLLQFALRGGYRWGNGEVAIEKGTTRFRGRWQKKGRRKHAPTSCRAFPR